MVFSSHYVINGIVSIESLGSHSGCRFQVPTSSFFPRLLNNLGWENFEVQDLIGHGPGWRMCNGFIVGREEFKVRFQPKTSGNDKPITEVKNGAP